MIKIANVVGSGNIGVELDISEIESDINLPYTEYEPSNYHGLYLRLVENGPLITVYRSGKYIISGCSSFEQLHKTNDILLKELSELGIMATNAEVDFTAQNVVCTAQLNDEVDLNTLSIELGLEIVEYEPEQFPGLIYRPTNHSAVLLIFANGKVVITGASDVDTAKDTFEHLQKRIKTHLSQ